MTTDDPSPDRFREFMLENEPNFVDVLTCVFGIKGHEARTYQVLLENPDSTVEELTEELNRDRSSVYRSLSTLQEKRLAERQRRLLDGGGHVYQYSATPLDEARDLMHETLDTWVKYVHQRIDDFGDGD